MFTIFGGEGGGPSCWVCWGEGGRPVLVAVAGRDVGLDRQSDGASAQQLAVRGSRAGQSFYSDGGYTRHDGKLF